MFIFYGLSNAACRMPLASSRAELKGSGQISLPPRTPSRVWKSRSPSGAAIYMFPDMGMQTMHRFNHELWRQVNPRRAGGVFEHPLQVFRR